MASSTALVALFFISISSAVLPCPSSAQYNSLADVSVAFATDPGADLAMADFVSAYILLDPNVSLTMTKTSTQADIVAAMSSVSIDFAVLGTGLTDSQAESFPNLVMYPAMVSCVVPIYRLDALGSYAPPLVFSREALAAIYLGNITWWNDSAIAATNPSQTLPAQRISMVLPTAGATITTVWTTALSKFSPAFNASIGVNNSPLWPLSSYAASTIVEGDITPGATVVATDGTLGFAYLSVALSLQVSTAAMINLAGSIVQASADSATFAAVELGTATRTRTTQSMDLMDGTGASVWPITTMSFLLIDTIASRSTCHLRAAVVEFWVWFFSNAVVSGLLANREYAPVPSIVLYELDVINELSTAITCRGEVALPTTATTTRLIGAPTSINFLSNLFANLYGSYDSTVVWEVQENTDDVILQQLVNAELDIAFVNPNNVDTELMNEVLADSLYLAMPVFLTADALAYNPQLAANISIAGYTVTLDMQTVGLIQYSCINYWNDPRILEQNPWLALLLPDVSVQPLLIFQVQGCGQAAQNPLEHALLDAVHEYQEAARDEVLLWCMNNYSQALLDASDNCKSIPAAGILFTPSEETVPSLLLGIPGSMGPIQATGDPSYGIVQITDYRAGVWANTTATVEGMLACASDTFNPDLFNTVTLPLGLSPISVNPLCYRATQQVMAVFLASYSSDTTDTSSCTRGYHTLTFMQWFINTPAIDVLINSMNAVRVTSVSNTVQTVELDALNKVLCDEQTLMVTPPVEWDLSAGVYGFVMLVSSVGLVACAVLAFFVFKFRHHPVIRSASPLFLMLSIAGLAVLFGAGYLLVAPVTTASCAAFSWLVNIGLMLTFAPLFAKTWRIYRIFGRKKLSVVVVSNKKLLLLVAALLGTETLLMAVWQGIGNLQAVTNDVQTSTPVGSSVPQIAARLIIDEYVQCGVPPGHARSMFAVICVEKGLLFVWGALMAFTTRKVTSTFNEAKGITLSLYNTCFTVGIIAPIILVIQATGDVLDLLLAFALLWIASFTGAMLFGPKLMTIYAKHDDTQNMSSIMASSSSSSGYAFLSLAALSTVSVLQGYLVALKKHVVQVEDKIARMKKHQVEKTVYNNRARGAPSPTVVSGTTSLKRPSPPSGPRNSTIVKDSLLFKPRASTSVESDLMTEQRDGRGADASEAREC
jgi:phosphate transport system substrate-binding protein